MSFLSSLVSSQTDPRAFRPDHPPCPPVYVSSAVTSIMRVMGSKCQFNYSRQHVGNYASRASKRQVRAKRPTFGAPRFLFAHRTAVSMHGSVIRVVYDHLKP